MRFGDAYKLAEAYAGLIVKPVFVARLDGWAFHTFTKKMQYEKPYDRRLTSAFVKTIQDFFFTFQPTIGYTFSDEVSFVFSKPTVFERVEKLDSLFAGTFSSTFSLTVGEQAAFDSRIIPLISPATDVPNYLAWRQIECKRNFINGYAEHMLRESGLSPAVAAKRLKGMNGRQLKEFCKDKGLDLEDEKLSAQRQGLLFFSENFTKDAFNPITQQPVKAERRRVTMMNALASFHSEAAKTMLDAWLAPRLE